MTRLKHSLHDHIGFWLNKFGQEVKLAFEAKLANENITIPQWCILISLYNEDASSVVELAQFIGIDKGAISRVTEQLISVGLVTRETGQDRRSHRLSLSKNGELLTKKLAQYADVNDEAFFSALTDQETKQLKIILKKLLAHAGVNTSTGWLNDS